jgi:16S rRNA processing protein RimM
LRPPKKKKKDAAEEFPRREPQHEREAIPPGFIELGRLTRPHGVRGEIRMHLHWEESVTLDEAPSITLFRGGKPLGERKIVDGRYVDKAVLLRLEGVADRGAAEALRGAQVCVPRALLPALAPGEYYLSDLIGARVVSPEGPLGEVVEIRMHPSVDSIVVKKPDGVLVEQPLVEPWIASVDTDAKVVELTSTDGLF